MVVPKEQQAWVYKKAGKPQDVLHLVPYYPVPVPKDDELVIRVRAGALNPSGWKVMSIWPLTYAMRKPAVPELEFSGEIVGGKTTDEFPLGSEVVGLAHTAISPHGTLAQYTVCSPTKNGGLALKPKNITHVQAAAIGAGGLTAIYSLQRGGLKKGAANQRVFVNGTGGVGTLAVQIAKAYGAYVVATGSPASEGLLKSLGVDEVIDYRSVSLVEHLTFTYASKPFDIVLDNVGIPSLFYASPAYLKEGGSFVDVGVKDGIRGLGALLLGLASVAHRALTPVILGGIPRKYVFIQVPPAEITPLMKQLATLLETKEIRTVIEREFAFTDVLEAYERIMTERIKGKLVVKID